MLERPVAATGVVAEDLDDDVCLYRSATNEVLVLNQSAGDVWRLCDGTSDIARIVATLATVYQRSADELAPDVHAVITDLQQRGYLVDAPAD